MKLDARTNTLILLFLFLLTSTIFITFPELDIEISRYFFENNFYLKDSWWERALYKSVPTLLLITIFGSLLLCMINYKYGKNICAVNMRKTLFLILVLVIGSGLIVNLVLKNNSGRARPVHITDFNGPKQYTPAFTVGNECERNCSFSSGHSSAAFFFLALAMLFKHRKTAVLIAFIYGCLVSFARIAAGGHFLSDCVVSFFIMAFTAILLYRLLRPNGEYPKNAHLAPTKQIVTSS